MEIANDLGRYYWSEGNVFAAKVYFNFKASNGWFDRWLKRFNLSHRSRTSQELPLALKEPFETHMKKDLEEFYENFDNKMKKIQRRLKRK